MLKRPLHKSWGNRRYWLDYRPIAVTFATGKTTETLSQRGDGVDGSQDLGLGKL